MNDAIVLAHARPDARIVLVGKRGGCKSTPQAFIERLMITAVREGSPDSMVAWGTMPSTRVRIS